MSKERLEKEGQSVSNTFHSIVNELQNKTENTNQFTGTIDLSLEFNSVSLEETGKVWSLFVRDDQTRKSISIKLATRIHVE